MKQIKLTSKQKSELKRISEYFLEATEIIDDIGLRAMVSVKILSRIGCLADRLVKKGSAEGSAVYTVEVVCKDCGKKGKMVVEEK